MATQSPDVTAMKQQCATLGDFITEVVVKELWAVQRVKCTISLSDFKAKPGAEHSGLLEADILKTLVAKLAPSLTADVLNAARGWVSAAAGLTPSSLLPDLDEFPPDAQDEVGLSLVQRKLLFETLEVILDVFNDPLVVGNLRPPLLPRHNLACVAAQIAAALEHCLIVRLQNTALTTDQGLDPEPLRHASSSKSGRSSVAGTRKELVEEMQLSKKQLFDIERQMAVQERNAELWAARTKREHEQATSRLFGINKELEEKLRQRTEEHRCSVKRVADLETRIQHEQWLREEMKTRVKKLEDELWKHTRMHNDILLREREYGKRILRLKLKEFEGLCHDEKRLKRLETVISGDAQHAQPVQLTEAELERLAKETLADLESEFEAFFEERQSQFQELVRRCEASFDLQRASLELSNRMHAASGSSQDAERVTSTAAQTDLTFPISMSAGEAFSAAGSSSNRATSCVGGLPEPLKRNLLQPVLTSKRSTLLSPGSLRSPIGPLLEVRAETTSRRTRSAH